MNLSRGLNMVINKNTWKEVDIHSRGDSSTPKSYEDTHKQKIDYMIEERNRKQRRNFIVGGILVGVLGAISLGTAYGISNYIDSQRKLERFKYIIPTTRIDRSYKINGDEVILEKIIEEGYFYDSLYLYISYRNITFRSDSERNLSGIYRHHDDNKEWIPKSQLNEYDEWEEMFQSLIDDIASQKRVREHEARMGIKHRPYRVNFGE